MKALRLPPTISIKSDICGNLFKYRSTILECSDDGGIKMLSPFRVLVNLLVWISVFLILIVWTTFVPETGDGRALIASSADSLVFACQVASCILLFVVAILLQSFGSLKEWLHLLDRLKEETSSVIMNMASISFSAALWNVVFFGAKPLSTFIAMALSAAAYGISYLLTRK